MFTHPAYARNPRPAYGELGGWDFYAFTLPNGFALGSKGEDIAFYLKSKGVVLEADNKLPNGTVLLIETGAPGLSNYKVLYVNGVPVEFTIAGRSVLLGGMGDGSLASTLENLLEDLAPKKEYSSGGVDKRADAEGKMWEMWKASPAKRAQTGVVAPSTTDTSLETVDAGEPATSDAGKPSASDKPKTGYYTDSGGYAWYYNAEKDYMEAIAAPKGAYSTQPRFDASKDAAKYGKMKGVLAADAFTTRADAISNATSKGGVELPSVAAGRPAPSAAPPADVAARGGQKQEEKKMVKGGLKGVVSSVPTWAWWTVGGLTLAGGSYIVWRIVKNK
jgi:hypothetical protein